MSILVCGGAGYIGSHAVHQLVEKGEDVVIVDNLQTGHRDALNPKAKFYEGDIRDAAILDKIFTENDIEAVIHFAANSLVGESVQKPLKYFNNNVYGMQVLLESMVRNHVDKIVFSSTAAVYGEPKRVPIMEDDPTEPTNPYGESKRTMEKMMKWVSRADGIRYVSLRYFNAAGALDDGSIGEDHNPETHLIPLILQVPLGKRDHITVFGDDYPTPDGTCLRDYIHVIDLADLGWDPRTRTAAGDDPPVHPVSAADDPAPSGRVADDPVQPSGFVPRTASSTPDAPGAARSRWQAALRGELLQRVNPVVQFLGLVAMTTPLMISIDVLSASIALVLELLLLPLVGISPRQVALRMVPLFVGAPLAALSMLLYASPGGQVYWQFGPAIISENSVTLSVAILVRVLALGLPAIAVLSRIDPTDMADGLSQVLHLPARPVLASLAGVRMAGLMVGDWQALRRARRVRGIGDGNRVATFVAGAFALLVLALRRSAKLSLTMEARGFGAEMPRTWARPSHVGVADLVMMMICVAVPVLALGAAVHWGVFQPLGR